MYPGGEGLWLVFVAVVEQGRVGSESWNAETHSNASPMLGIFRVLDGGTDGMVANRLDQGVEIGWVVDACRDAFECIAVLLIDVEFVNHLDNENLVLLHLARVG